MDLFRSRFVRLLLIIAICICFALMVEQAWAAYVPDDMARCSMPCEQRPSYQPVAASTDSTAI